MTPKSNIKYFTEKQNSDLGYYIKKLYMVLIQNKQKTTEKNNNTLDYEKQISKQVYAFKQNTGPNKVVFNMKQGVEIM